MLAAVFESQAGTGNEVLDCARYQYFACSRQRRDSCADRHPDPHNLAVADLEFAGVQAGSDVDADVPARVYPPTGSRPRAYP